MTELKHKFGEDIEGILSKKMIDEEYLVEKGNRTTEISEFESLVEMLECKRGEKDYDWMSDIFIPELPSIILTDASGWANQYFQTRDFVEVKLDGNDKDDPKKAEAAKRTINSTLNRRGLYHYQKYIRGRTINSLGGQVYAICWWTQNVLRKQTGTQTKEELLDVDVNGNPMTSEDQIPATRPVQEPVFENQILADYFDYEIVDPRNVVTDRKYCYSIQQKDWLCVRSEKTYEQLKANETKNGYFNLDIVKELKKTQGKTETSAETYEKNEPGKSTDRPTVIYFDNILRLGKLWAIVKERYPDGYPKSITPGYDTDGDILDKAELVEGISEWIIVGNQRVLIRFQPTPYRDSLGNPFKPVVRGWCYIHPTKDIGLSDGKNLREIQIGINDAFNLTLDREKLATVPTLKGKKYSLEDNATIFFAPEHVMELEDPKDIEEFKLQSNTSPMLELVGMMMNKGNTVTAVFPSTMGQVPAEASTTATAVAGAESRGNLRANYKSLTYEYTFHAEFYWIILQMVYNFALEETVRKMMGDVVDYFDPNPDYTYSPVSSNVEMEYNKYKKLQIIDQFIGRLVKFPNPKTVPLLNYLLSLAFGLFGKEFPEYKKILLDESVPVTEEDQGAPAQQTALPPAPTSNQTGNLMTTQEETTRLGIQ